MEKKIKKIIVNALTSTRILGTIALPIMINTLSAPIFIMIIGLMLFTDFLDGLLARKWEVSTIFGSILDMTADKLFGISILIVLSSIYPVMSIALLLEIVISVTNIIDTKHGNLGKSSQIGRIKTMILGLSICSLLLVGLSPEIANSLNFLKQFNMGNILNTLSNNKKVIETVAQTAAITSEGIAATDYLIKSIKNPNKDKKNVKILELIKNKQFLNYLKEVLFDEKYFQVTKDMPLSEKLIVDEEKQKELKKLMKNI